MTTRPKKIGKRSLKWVFEHFRPFIRYEEKIDDEINWDCDSYGKILGKISNNLSFGIGFTTKF